MELSIPKNKQFQEGIFQAQKIKKFTQKMELSSPKHKKLLTF